jgi:hypothetical protein
MELRLKRFDFYQYADRGLPIFLCGTRKFILFLCLAFDRVLPHVSVDILLDAIIRANLFLRDNGP